MITINVIERVFHLKYGQGTGTCFAIDVDNKQYLVTAKHVVDTLVNKQEVEIYHNGNWVKVSINLIGHHPTADISVFSIDTILARHHLEPSSHGIAYGQDTYFLGFPYRIQSEKGNQINRNFPIPLVKKAILSCITNDGTGAYMLLDGINNPGFSGGPVVFSEPGIYNYRIAGVISGYKSVEEPTYHQGQQTPLSIRINTGIIIAYTINHAIDLINQNPTGTVIK